MENYTRKYILALAQHFLYLASESKDWDQAFALLRKKHSFNEKELKKEKKGILNLLTKLVKTFQKEKKKMKVIVDELSEIDKSLCFKMKSNGTEHFACCLIEGVDKPLALLFVSFKNPVDSTTHNCTFVRENIRHIALEQALLLELNKHTSKY